MVEEFVTDCDNAAVDCHSHLLGPYRTIYWVWIAHGSVGSPLNRLVSVDLSGDGDPDPIY